MYYKFSGFTQKLAGAWAADAYSPQVGRHRAGRGAQSRRARACGRRGPAFPALRRSPSGPAGS